MKKLPIGIQTFEKIRDKNEDYVYVDKTRYALELITQGEYYFLSRPRRFGKSLFVDTLKEVFEGNRELLKGLYIYDKWDWSIRYPVINISFAEGILKNRKELDEKILEILHRNQKRLQIGCEYKSISGCFSELIEKARERYGQPVVILIDEYDKPILDNITDIEVAREMREGLKNLYSVIKGQDANIKFAFLTGVSKFSKTSIFSGLNNLNDISLDRAYGNICGYTQEELEGHFREWLEGVDMKRVKDWYNGYNFLGDKLYNPFDILLFLNKGKEFDSYWFETGTPSFLVKLIEEKDYFLPKFSNLVVSKSLLSSFDIDNLDIEVILYQAGYLTIDKVIVDEDYGFIDYKLKLPNLEVRRSFFEYIINFFYKNERNTKAVIQKALINQDLEGFKDALISLFASIPYTHYVKNSLQYSEGLYATVVYVYLQSIGVDIVGEDVTNRGRIDITVKFPKTIYIMEIKVSDEDPLQQIKAKGYHEKYLSEGKDIYLVGISFDPEKKNVRDIVWERVR